MKKFKFSISTAIILLLTYGSAYAQTSVDALRYSRIFYEGTARFQGMAGAFGATGADFSVLATNPAGIGLYQSTEMTITPSVYWLNSESNYNNALYTETKGMFALGNMGFVFTVKKHKDHTGGLQNFNIGFGLNRQNDFNARIYMAGPNNSSSLMTSYVNTLNAYPGGISPDQVDNQYPFDIGPAMNANLIWHDSLKGYLCDAPNGGVYQEKGVTSSGSINEFDMSWGGNYSDKLYFGATVGIPMIRYHETSTYMETRMNPSVYPFYSLTYNQYLNTSGVGVNFKAGVIYRPAAWFRIGAAIHTPTYYGYMRDDWNSDITSVFSDNPQWSNTQYSPLGTYRYHMTTPFRAIGSLAFIISKYGLLSAEYEYVNYNQARFHSSDEYSYESVNGDIKSSYSSPVNVRAGTEWRILNFRVRGGFGYYGSPYGAGSTVGERWVASGGVGYRGKYFFVDMAYTWSKMTQDYYFYDPTLVNPSKNTLRSNLISTTFGVRF
jgi:hypothetical protein